MIKFWRLLLLSAIIGAVSADSYANSDSDDIHHFLYRLQFATHLHDVQVLLREPNAPQAISAETAYGLALRSAQLEGSGSHLTPKIAAVALLLSGVPSKDLPEDLDVLSPNEIQKLTKYDYPLRDDLIRYLLLRGPAISSAPSDGGYSVTRMGRFDKQMSQRLLRPDDLIVLREITNVDYLGLTADTPKTSDIRFSNDIIPDTPGELAQTRDVQLVTIAPIVAAAKIAGLIEKARSPSDRATLEAVLAALLIQVRLADDKALDGVRLSSTSALDDIDKLPIVPENLQKMRGPLAASKARAELGLHRFALARRSLQELAEGRYGPSGQPLSVLGLLIVAIVANNDSSGCDIWDSIESVQSRVVFSPELTWQVAALIAAMSDEKRASCGSAATRVTSKLGSPADLPDQLGWAMRLDELIFSAGEADVGTRFMLARVLAEHDAHNRQEELEKKYLRELAAYTRDLFYLISFHMSYDNDWVPVQTSGTDSRADFLDIWDKNDCLTVAGQIITTTSSIPYAMKNPESDLSTSSTAYGLPIGYHAPPFALMDFEPQTPGNKCSGRLATREQYDGSEAFRKWAEDSLMKLPPSAAPYLKLTAIEWFLYTMEDMKRLDFHPAEFHYKPLAGSGYTSSEMARRVIGSLPPGSQSRSVLDLMLQVKTALERLYP